MSSDRSRRLARIGRLMLVAGTVCGIGATGWWLTGEFGEVVLDVEPAIAVELPTTIAPRPAVDATGPSPTLPAATDVAPTTSPSTPTLSALLGGRGSAILPTIEPRVEPTTLTIEQIDVHHPVRAVGLEDDGQLEVPGGTEIGWYRYGAAPGHRGATVLAAHVSWNRRVGPFRWLGELEPGDLVDVGLDDGTTRTYEVTERTRYDKDELPPDRIWRNSGPESLVLITCGGSFNPEIRRYRQNVVVYAVPVAHRPGTDAPE